LEASVSRTQAHEAFNEYLEQARREERKTIDLLHDEAVDFARSVEHAAFKMANLSIQELISCDTAADEGCIGGNPLLAFYFIHRYGLTSWSQYPYVGSEDYCRKRWVSRPVAKVKSWGIISPNHEHHMLLALRFIGPIAVGVNGAERSFLAYQDGIFDKPYCRQGANHALLITGYGQEETSDGKIVKYWIARNSWGRNWGENGYVRVRRNTGMKGEKGVCGIARSPSVALGGVLLTNRHRLAPYHTPRTSQQTDSEPMSTSPRSSFCGRFGFDTCHGIVE
jgi:Papain family cysteine protease